MNKRKLTFTSHNAKEKTKNKIHKNVGVDFDDDFLFISWNLSQFIFKLRFFYFPFFNLYTLKFLDWIKNKPSPLYCIPNRRPFPNSPNFVHWIELFKRNSNAIFFQFGMHCRQSTNKFWVRCVVNQLNGIRWIFHKEFSNHMNECELLDWSGVVCKVK